MSAGLTTPPTPTNLRVLPRPPETEPMKPIRPLWTSLLGLAALAAGCGAQAGSDLVLSSDPELRALASEVLPDIVVRSGMELVEPVRLEIRTSEELDRYIRSKLDEDLPEEEARARVAAYSMLGLVDADLDLRSLLLGLYGEQVAGFYEPDSSAFFVIEGQPEATLRPLLVHELVHAVQDQTANLSFLTDSDLDNDQASAAMAAIEGHATLVMFEYLAEQMAGTPLDLATVADFAAQVRPALEATAQFPALAAAPRVVRESLLFPYVEGAIFVHDLWSRSDREPPFGDAFPLSTEQVFRPGAAAPLRIEAQVGSEGGVEVGVSDARVVLSDVLGSLELGIFIEDVLGVDGSQERARGLADGWDGDRYVLVEFPGGDSAMAWSIVWDSEDARDRFSDRFSSRFPDRVSNRFSDRAESGSEALAGRVRLERVDVGGRPASVVRIGEAFPVRFSIAGEGR
jgi:hypothetical protein